MPMNCARTLRDRDLTNIADRHRMELSACISVPHDHSMRGQAVLCPVTQDGHTARDAGYPHFHSPQTADRASHEDRP
jgi:hypothetical protein